MTTLDAAVAMAAELPEVTEGTTWGNRAWFVAGGKFAWVRPFSKADVKRFGDETPPAGPILAVLVADLSEKHAVIAEHPGPLFSIEHLDNYPAVLIDLPRAPTSVVKDSLLDAWLAAAPAALAGRYFPNGA